jgi:predicted MFS family arabinose efflux permease
VSAKPRRHHNVTLVILALACTAFAIQQTMVIPALPMLQRHLHTSTTWATGVGFAFAAMSTLIAENVRPEETGVATGVNTVMRSIGGVVGAARRSARRS